MFKLINKIKELEKRISQLENANSLPSSPSEKPTSTYEEVINEWLNGKRQ